MAGADLVVEAVVENLEVKAALFARARRLTRPEAILASNTSSISITKLGAATKRPDKVIGMHFMNPVPLMTLVEVIRGQATSDETMRTVMDLARGLGKTPVEVNDYPGFVANRVLMPMINEAIFAVYEGVATAGGHRPGDEARHEPSDGAADPRRLHRARRVPGHPEGAARRPGRPQVPRLPAAEADGRRGLARPQDAAAGSTPTPRLSGPTGGRRRIRRHVFLLPLSREGGGPRRVPWLTIAIVVANTTALVVLVAATDESAVERRVADLVGFVRTHPYLELSPAAADLLSERTLDRLATARERSLAADLPPMEEFDEARRALDAQEEAVFAAIRDLPSHRWGFVPREPWSVSLLTSFFMHAGWMHLLGNMLFLWITSPFVEDRLGRPGFAAFYLAAGLAGNTAHWMRYPGADIPLVGASGAVAGMMGAFVVFFARSRIRFLVLPLPIVVALPVLLVMPIWLAEQMWLSRYSDGSNVAFGAHVGGFMFGLAVAGIVRLARPEEPALVRASGGGGVEGDREALEDAIAGGEMRAIEAAGGRLLDRLRQAGDGAAVELALSLRERLGPPLPVRLWTSCASVLERPDPEAALAMYDDVVRAAPAEAAALRAHLRRGELYKRLGRAADARRALERALAHAGCTAGMRDTVERSLAGLGAPPR